MKIEVKRIKTKAFQADVLVQNGRIVHAPKVIGAYCRLRFHDLENWLKKFHKGYTIETVERRPKQHTQCHPVTGAGPSDGGGLPSHQNK